MMKKSNKSNSNPQPEPGDPAHLREEHGGDLLSKTMSVATTAAKIATSGAAAAHPIAYALCLAGVLLVLGLSWACGLNCALDRARALAAPAIPGRRPTTPRCAVGTGLPWGRGWPCSAAR
jgi:hypothetical protein